jgi:hypothetical protein
MIFLSLLCEQRKEKNGGAINFYPSPPRYRRHSSAAACMQIAGGLTPDISLAAEMLWLLLSVTPSLNPFSHFV